MWDHNWGWHDGWFQEDGTSSADTMKYSSLYDQVLSLSSSGNSSSGTNPVPRHKNIPRNEGSVPAAAATTAVYNIAEQPTIVYSFSISDIESSASATTREARLASAVAKQATAQREYELARANR